MQVAINCKEIQDPSPMAENPSNEDVKRLFTAYGCVVLEEWSGKSYLYTAANLKSGKALKICRRSYPIKPSSYETIADKIRTSRIAGRGRFEIDVPAGERLPYDSPLEIMHHIFNNILPSHGYGIRETQIELAEHILDAMSRRSITLAEAGVGIGKTHAYMIAAAIIKRGRVNDFWLHGCYGKQSYADSSHMPIVIATSSIALQKAIMTEYIPEISKILMEHKIIKTPLTCVMRKGREHYVCENKVLSLIKDSKDLKLKVFLERILENGKFIDLGNIAGLSPYLKRRIGVTVRCEVSCPHYKECRYMKYMEKAQSRAYDLQVCNHNYLLADILRRKNDSRPLIPDYQAVIIDEAHKFMQAAHQMYGSALEFNTIPKIASAIQNLSLKNDYSRTQLKKLWKQLIGQNQRLFELLTSGENNGYDVLSVQSSRYFRNTVLIAGELKNELSNSIVADKHTDRRVQAVHALSEIQDKAAMFEDYTANISWMEHGNPLTLTAIPKRLNQALHDDLWSMKIPIVLTSGTLSAGGSFEYVKRKTGLDLAPARRLLEITKPSPFNYKENVLLYLSENTPFPDQKDKEYLNEITDEIEKLIIATSGHAVVLFTSYNVMGYVFSKLQQRGLSYPLFRMGKSDTATIGSFKESKNGVLFASGIWEGIDIPGDMLSLLIIVKLPFDAPDPVSEYEQTLYGSMKEYKRKVIVPEMLVKLMQAFGRLIRLETDTGVVAILDSRVRKGGTYRQKVLNALPECRVTSQTKEVQRFICEKKSDEYFTGGKQTMQFKDEQHKVFYNTALERSGRADDPYHKAMFYVLGLCEETRLNIDDIYDFTEHAIKFECFNKGWQTTGSLRITRMAFNLFNGFCGLDNSLEAPERDV